MPDKIKVWCGKCQGEGGKLQDCIGGNCMPTWVDCPDCQGEGYKFKTFLELAKQLGICCENCERLRYCNNAIVIMSNEFDIFYCADFKRKEENET